MLAAIRPGLTFEVIPCKAGSLTYTTYFLVGVDEDGISFKLNFTQEEVSLIVTRVNEDTPLPAK